MTLQFLADGLISGSLIGLGAIGVTLTYSILRFSNFAHGDLMAWGAYAALGLLAAITAVIGPVAPIGALSFGWPLILSAGLAMAAIGGMALVLVTHNMDAVKSLCSKAAWLDHGVIRAYGSAEEVVQAYTASSQ